MQLLRLLYFLLLSTLFFVNHTISKNSIIPGRLKYYETLHCIGLTWYIAGDQNNNCSTKIFYRVPAGMWHEALPLVRVTPQLLQGSIFGLEPDQTYEILIQLTDPDGGAITRKIIAKTKINPITKKYKMNRTFHVVQNLNNIIL